MLPPRAIVPVLLIIAAGALSLWVWLETLDEKEKPFRWGDAQRRSQATPESQVAGIIIFLMIILVAKGAGAFGG